MGQAEPDGQDARADFVGREAELAAFRRNFELAPGQRGRRLRFHVHGNSGVGKTFLVGELTRLARERGALTAYVDEDAGSVPDALEMICRQFAGQGRRLKGLERRLGVYRERRREAEAAALATLTPEPEAASAGSRTLVNLGIGALGTAVPGAAFAAQALPADRLAQGADRLRAGLGARFRGTDDLDLVRTPEKVLTPVLLGELRAAASAVPGIVLFFDVYERTGAFLDPWLHDLLRKPEKHGPLPDSVLVVTAGQHPLHATRWSGSDVVADLPLAPFTEAETRRLLAGRGVVAEPVVSEVLRLTGGLPVLVSTLAQDGPGDPGEVGDPSADAVDRFLGSEPPVRRDVAGLCALPRWLDADVFRVLVDLPDGELDAQYAWLTSLPFVGERGPRVQYHDVVRALLLRYERRHHPRRWPERHRRLAAAFGEWRADAEAGLPDDELWQDEEWRALRLEETYHLLCARPPAALADALRLFVEACRQDEVVGRRWARMLEDAGTAADHQVLRELGRELGTALADEETGALRAMDLLLARPGLDNTGRAAAHALRGRELRHTGEYARALEEYDHAVELDPGLAQAHYGRGFTLQLMDDFTASLAALDRADELAPGTGWILAARAETHRLAGHYEEAVADFGRAVAIDPTDAVSLTGRAVARHVLGRYDEALADFNRSLSIDDDLWTRVRRARLLRSRGELEQAFAEFDLAVSRAPDAAWIASERGDNYRLAGRHEDAVAELGRALALTPDYPSALASRGASLYALGRDAEALADLDRAVELKPGYGWALVMRSRVREQLGDRTGQLQDLERADAADPDTIWILRELSSAYRYDGRHEEALRCVNRALELDPDDGWAYGLRARVGLATGRDEQALADLDRCLETEPDWARRKAVELLILCERWDEAAERLAGPGTEHLDDLRLEVHRHHGRWDEARRIAERLTGMDPLTGTFELALTVSRSEGLTAAAPHWRELARHTREDGRLGAAERAQGRCFIGCALADWAEADAGLAEVFAADLGWDGLLNLSAILTDLLHSPGADTTAIAVRLETVTRARDALKARYADPA
ncbi:tetratricopeptide repeat protein [Streptomyces sp. NPDC047081]|uniref:tetratricopeptide repeat protein n=1 Tax=Streptomyces sp. NPDC047081 TaxID=3154706 RepID=UPI0033C0E29D